MTQTHKILAVSPGITTTKIAVFEDGHKLYAETIEHTPEILGEFGEPQSQLPFRTEAVLAAVGRSGVRLEEISLFAGRGGGLLGLVGGTYEVDGTILDHASRGMPGPHPAQLGSQIVNDLAKLVGGRAFIVNSPDTDELQDLARPTGFSDIFRIGATHALSQKEVAARYCQAEGVKYGEVNLIVCHIGGGLSVTAHRKGMMVDSNNILGGDGPMAPNRAGTLPAIQFMRLCYGGKVTQKEMERRLTRAGGLAEHLGTYDGREIERRIKAGDRYAALVYDAMIYQVGKTVGEMACAQKGEVRAILLTGDLARSAYLVSTLKGYVGWIAPVVAMPGEFEMEALAAGALRVAQGLEEGKKYSGKARWEGFEHLKGDGHPPHPDPPGFAPPAEGQTAQAKGPFGQA
ncbi:MAG: butyrate kinase [Deltaproteobacteria bacterium]|jgi:butyrate kinase|nr:butyrate kinase [Deltaproteobacteria bacterium]